ncbi:MAG: HD domain-containing protein [bacterium]|nr:HD domain-containing protein [bacterium]
MRVQKFSALDLIALPPLERAIMRHLLANDPLSVETVRAQVGGDTPPDAFQAAVQALIDGRWLRQTDDGRVEPVGGQVMHRTALPPQLWSPMCTLPRSFSASDIQVLRVAVPILHFVRSKLAEFTDHGPTHALRVRDYAIQLGYLMQVSVTEQYFLRIAALFHDVGNVVNRASHHIVSQQTVERLAESGDLPLTAEEAAVVGLVCRWHRKDKEYDPARIDSVNGETIRTGLLGAIIRIADAMDIDVRRADYSESMRTVLAFFFPEQMPYWSSLDVICGVRIRCAPDITIQVFTSEPVTDNMQIEMLRADIASTPIRWQVEPHTVAGEPSTSTAPPASGKKALLAFPFNAHSLVMGAISRKHLQAAGYAVDVFCYADTPESAESLWRDELDGRITPATARLVSIGGRLADDDAALLTGQFNRWIGAGMQISLLNRHEQTWSWSPWLLQAGVELILGGDWSYFWGSDADSADLRWARVAALCGRDPAQAAMRFTEHENALANGLLLRLRESLHAARTHEQADWTALAAPLLDAIQADDAAFFERDVGDSQAIPMLNGEPLVRGRVLVFDALDDVLPTDLYWILEAAIERKGLMLEQGIQFRVPYAVAVRPVGDGDQVDVLAIRHWREEAAPAIRFLFPRTGYPLEGNENTVFVRLPAGRAADLVRQLTDACNR